MKKCLHFPKCVLQCASQRAQLYEIRRWAAFLCPKTQKQGLAETDSASPCNLFFVMKNREILPKELRRQYSATYGLFAFRDDTILFPVCQYSKVIPR